MKNFFAAIVRFFKRLFGLRAKMGGNINAPSPTDPETGTDPILDQGTGTDPELPHVPDPVTDPDPDPNENPEPVSESNPLLEEVRAACKRLAPSGWQELMLHHGVDILASDLEAELTKSLSGIDRSLPGFEDFHASGSRAIVAGKPAHSLLYHAFASARVHTGPDGNPLGAFPTLAEIEAVENYLYAKRETSLSDLLNELGDEEVAVAVFSYGYRPAVETVHKQFADMCYARTGVARVGNAEAQYDAKTRAFTPIVDQDDHATRVLPAKYAAFIAVRRLGDRDGIGPMRFQENGDQNREFWVPVHKLFPGEQCLKGSNLDISLETFHINEKLRRLHAHWGPVAGANPAHLNEAPYVITEGLAELETVSGAQTGWLHPSPHPLIEKATRNGELVTFTVPPGLDTLSSSLEAGARSGRRRRAPEFVHARTMVVRKSNGEIEEIDLNLRSEIDGADLITHIERGGYEALHYIDFTADGWVKAHIPSIAGQLPLFLSAYSLVTAPDFFFNCDQRELLDWHDNELDSDLRNILSWIHPGALSDERIAPNMQIPNADFGKTRDALQTYTAVVNSFDTQLTGQAGTHPLQSFAQAAYLPDAASGTFAPGWDVSFDSHEGTDHLASYGLGSPFPEDEKLCAALSTFWPAVAPDITRSFEPGAVGNFPTVSPLTDAELGMDGSAPWDGIQHPLFDQTTKQVEYPSFDRADYVTLSLDDKFLFSRFQNVDGIEYRRRMEAMLRGYQAIGAFDLSSSGLNRSRKAAWAVLSFRKHQAADTAFADVNLAEAESGISLTPAQLYRIVMFRHGDQRQTPGTLDRIQVDVEEMVTVYTDLNTTIIKRESQPWQASLPSLT